MPDGDGVHLILASTGPGIFGGDTLVSTIRVESGARVRLTSQSSLQVHPSRDGQVASIESCYRVEAGAHLQCEWDPAIPFPLARLRQRIRIEMDQDATLFWSDALMAGRYARGERWQFALMDHEICLRRADRLAYMERYRLEPEAHLDSPWCAGTASYFGSVLGVDPTRTRADAERLDTLLQEVGGVTAGADLPGDALLLARLMSDGGPAFHAARECCRAFLTDTTTAASASIS